MKKFFFISFTVFAFIACSKKTTSPSSGAGPTPDKAKAETMYASEIKPVLELKCSPCHFPDKGGNKAALDNFDAASKIIEDVIRRVQLDPSAPGYMPFKGKKDALTAAEIASLKSWKATLGK